MRITVDKKKTLLFLKLCSILCVAALILFLLYALGYRINVSNSLPNLVYKIAQITDKPTVRGDYVVVDHSLIANNPAIKTGLERKYLERYPMLKQIGAVPGDVVLLRDNILYINGIKHGEMIVLSADSHGLQLSPFPTPVTLQPGQYWLISNPHGGYDSRYFGWINRDCITHTAYPVF